MADSRKSSRARKAVNYSAFVGGEDDDDFADPTPPPKKTKLSNKENLLKVKKNSGENNTRRRQKDDCSDVRVHVPTDQCSKRRSLDEKVFDRDLEAALKLSIESSGTVEICEVDVETHTGKEAPIVCGVTESTKSSENTSISNKRPLSSSAVEDLEIIELSSELETVTETKRKRRKAVKYDDDDDENEDEKEVWKPSQALSEKDDEDDESDDEFDPNDSDSDFGSSRKKKTSKAKCKSSSKTPAKQKPVDTKSKPNTTVTPVNKSRSAAKVGSKSASKNAPSTPSYSTPVRLSGGSAKRSWAPPSRTGSSGSPLSSNSIKSPSSGLRLGLSRNQRVKSLHPAPLTT